MWSSSTFGCLGCGCRAISPCCSMVLSRIMMACGLTKQARASVAAVMPCFCSSSASATYCASVSPTGLSAAVLDLSIACSARLTSMPTLRSSAPTFLRCFISRVSSPRHKCPKPPRLSMSEVDQAAIEGAVRRFLQRKIQQRDRNFFRWRSTGHIEPLPRRAGVDQPGRDRGDQDSPPHILRPPLRRQHANGGDLADLRGDIDPLRPGLSGRKSLTNDIAPRAHRAINVIKGLQVLETPVQRGG